MKIHSVLRAFCRVLLISLLASAACYVQPDTRSLVATKAVHQPSMENPSDTAWSAATTVSGFKQREPFEGRPATEKTSVRVLYDKHALYFLIHCYDSEPRRIVATELRRDADLNVDDYFTVLISPNHDGRNGYEFSVNALGTQADSLIAEEGRVNDSNWDGSIAKRAQMPTLSFSTSSAYPGFGPEPSPVRWRCREMTGQQRQM